MDDQPVTREDEGPPRFISQPFAQVFIVLVTILAFPLLLCAVLFLALVLGDSKGEAGNGLAGAFVGVFGLLAIVPMALLAFAAGGVAMFRLRKDRQVWADRENSGDICNTEQSSGNA